MAIRFNPHFYRRTALAFLISTGMPSVALAAYTYRVPVPGFQGPSLCPSDTLTFSAPQVTTVAIPTGCGSAIVSVSGASGAGGQDGAGGGAGNATTGGQGYKVSAVIPIQGQPEWQVVVGQGGHNSGYAGHGGGLSAICKGACSAATALVVAGGGGGGATGGTYNYNGGPGQGINALSSGLSGLGANGGYTASYAAWTQYSGGGGAEGGGGGFYGGSRGTVSGYVYYSGGTGGSSYVAPSVQLVQGSIGGAVNGMDGVVTIQFKP